MNIALLIEYDGTNYKGWQTQANAITVQQTIEQSIELVIANKINLIGSGRTDAGVHASGQVANFRINEINIPEDKLVKAINSKLPRDIRIKDAKYVKEDFHARFDASARRYSYTLACIESVFDRHFSTFYKFPFDKQLLLDSGKFFVGKYCFTSFSKNNPDTKNYICNIEECIWEEQEKFLRLRIKADRFVYGMVRSIVGAMLEYSRKKISREEILFKLNNPKRDRISPLAAPNGLVLEEIYYSDKIF